MRAEKDIARLQVLANKGDPTAQWRLGDAYLRGKGTDVNMLEAARYFAAAATQGHSEGQWRLGTMVFFGHGGLRRDHVEALRLYRLAAAQGSRDGMRNIALSYEWGTGVAQDYSEAEAWFRKAAELQDSKSQFHLGRKCENRKAGDDADNLTEAVSWYKQSADRGCHLAQIKLGMLHIHGKGVKQDYKEAIKWLKKAAPHACSAEPRYVIAMMHHRGLGVVKDSIEKTLRRLQKAATDHHVRQGLAMYKVADIYRTIKKDDAEALLWYEKAVTCHYPSDSHRGLLDLFLTEKEIAEDKVQSQRFFQKQADRKVPVAQYMVACSYEYGLNLLPQDDIRSALWYRAGAKAGHAASQYKLSQAYAEGRGVMQSTPKSIEWLRKAAEQSNSKALFSLGQRLLVGDGLPKDVAEAERLLVLAEEHGSNAIPKTNSERLP